MLVDFIDIDRPLVVACLDNGSVQAPDLVTRQGRLKAITANAASSFMQSKQFQNNDCLILIRVASKKSQLFLIRDKFLVRQLLVPSFQSLAAN
ncbi:MAG: hypothetical protein CTY18_10740 [Methylomonas sp.]|nr:MAG: hypothetical protein CTY24_12430 [Methylobacter sp.]PPD32287.1 MAG: hypothetical protein CTY18_10740 [Methylomonas sp.]